LERFRTVILLGGKTATGFEVPPDVVARLGSTKKPAVRVTIGPHTYRSTVAVMGGAFLVPLNARNRAAAGVAAGDEIEVGLELDTEPRVVTMPPDLEGALDAGARRVFDGLSYTRRREIVEGIEDAKTPATRERRIQRAVAALRDGGPGDR
jgi:hypothetical protein